MASRHDKTAADIRETHGRRYTAIAWTARVPEFREVCAFWHNRFGACLVLDRPRLSALIARMVDGPYKLEDVLAAIEAYHAHVQTDPWHRERPQAVKTLAAFLDDEKFETWASEGKLARAKLACAQTRDQFAGQARQAAAERTRLRQRLDSLPVADRRAIVEQAHRELAIDQVAATAQAVMERALTILARERSRFPQSPTPNPPPTQETA